MRAVRVSAGAANNRLRRPPLRSMALRNPATPRLRRKARHVRRGTTSARIGDIARIAAIGRKDRVRRITASVAVMTTGASAMNARNGANGRNASPIPIHPLRSWLRSRRNLNRVVRNGPRRLDRQRVDKWLWHARVVRTRKPAVSG